MIKFGRPTWVGCQNLDKAEQGGREGGNFVKVYASIGESPDIPLRGKFREIICFSRFATEGKISYKYMLL